MTKPKQGLLANVMGSQLGISLLSLLVFLVLWEVMVRALGIREFLLPAPSKIFQETYADIDGIALHALATLKTIALGFVISVCLSFPIALGIASSKKLAGIIYPVLVLTQSIPKIALAPLLVVMLGANEMPRLVITFLVAFFPLVISISSGLLAVPAELIELSRAYKGSKWDQLVRIRIPYAIPFIFSGLKVAITLCVVGAVTAEFVNADQGLGYLIVTSTAFFKVPLAFAGVMTLSLIGILLFQAIVLLEKILFPWSTGNNTGSH